METVWTVSTEHKLKKKKTETGWKQIQKWHDDDSNDGRSVLSNIQCKN